MTEILNAEQYNESLYPRTSSWKKVLEASQPTKCRKFQLSQATAGY